MQFRSAQEVRRKTGSDSRKAAHLGMPKYCMAGRTHIPPALAAFTKPMAYAHPYETRSRTHLAHDRHRGWTPLRASSTRPASSRTTHLPVAIEG